MKNHTPPHTLAPPLQPPGFTSLLRWMVFSLLAVFAPVLQAGIVTSPTIDSPASADLSYTTATLGGTVTGAGDPIATHRGVVYSASNPDPEFGDLDADGVSLAFDGTPGPFTVAVEALDPNTEYTFKAFVSNDGGATFVYTAPSTFTTLAYPTVVSTPADASYTSATLGGNVTSVGNPEATERGVVYSVTTQNGNPLVDGADVIKVPDVDPGIAGLFSVPSGTLTPDTGYTFKAYAKYSEGGYVYSAPATFTTLAYPTVGSPTSASVLDTTALLGGTVTSQGGSALVERGVVYTVKIDETTIPDLDDSKAVAEGTTVDLFTVGVENLLSGTTYVYRAYATNEGGTGYSAVGEFTTVTTKPTVSLDPLDPPVAAPTSITFTGVVDHDGGLAITERGFVYSATSDVLTIGAANTTRVLDTIPDGEDGTGAFDVLVTGRTPGVTYNYVAYARNSKGVTYSEMDTVTTLADVPTVASPTKTLITSTGATLGGNVTKSNGSDIIERGVVVYSSVDQDPTLETPEAGAIYTAATGATTGIFTKAVEGLNPATTYYFRAYAENGEGYGYSAASTVTTLSGPPVVTTGGVDPSKTSAVLVGEVTVTGGAAVSDRGIVISRFGTNPSPTVGGLGVTKVAASEGGLGEYLATATGLLPGIKYAYCAYAVNIRGTSYGEVGVFFTDADKPTVTSPTKASIAATSVTLGGTIARNNGSPVTSYGVKVYQSGQEVDDVFVVGAKLGPFTMSVTGLDPGTAYTFKPYATNGAGTTLSSTAGSFTTLALKPTVVTTSGTLTGEGISTARVVGSVSDNNGATVTKYGVVYSVSNTKPIIGGAGVLKSEVIATPTGAFTVNLSSLKAGKTYYYRAYAVNRMGAGYGIVRTITMNPDAPTVAATPTSSSITTKSATLGGRVVSDNGAVIRERGVVYSKTSTDSTPTIGEDGVTKKASTTPSTGSFSVSVGSLSAATRYSFRAYARNDEGTTYSDPVIFTTLASSGTVSAGALATADTTETYYTTDAATGLKYLTIVVAKAAGTAPVVEVSGNLTDWFSGSSHTTVVSDDAGVLVVRDNTPVTAGVKRYIRVKP